MDAAPPDAAPPPGPGTALFRALSRFSNRAESLAERYLGRALEFFEERAVDVILRRLETELATYELRVPNDMTSFMRLVRVGDIVLIEGRRRISWVVQKITSSPWSHVGLYVGSGQLLEAEDHGVELCPVMKYAEHNIRLCTPRGLDETARAVVVDLASESLGRRYDRTNVRNLMLAYFARARRPREFIGNLEECQEMCSSLIARAFEALNYPILPNRHPSQIVPRDFDLSPNFDVVKFNALNGRAGTSGPSPDPICYTEGDQAG